MELENTAGELLAEGIARFLSGAELVAAEEDYARIRHRLAARPLPAVLPMVLNAGAAAPPRQIAFFDIETLGFIGRPLFLIGALYARASEGGAWDLDLIQYLARDYSEEEAILSAFQREVSPCDLWISFNGRTFDLPFLQLRAVAYRLPRFEPRAHLDLLPLARRTWGELLPNCRLKTLETHICRRPRGGPDLPSSRVPAAYHAFVRSGEPMELLDILGHNASDLTGLLEIYLHAVRHHEDVVD